MRGCALQVKKVPAGLGRKSRPGRGQTDPEQASLRPEEHDVSEDENSILSTWCAPATRLHIHALSKCCSNINIITMILES